MLGIGTDIVGTGDIAQRLARSENFAGFVFSDAERIHGESLSVPERSFAGKFAAKEAFLKAIGIGIMDGVPLPEIEVVATDNRVCEFRLGPSAEAALRRTGGTKAHLSISHGRGMAMAMVVVI